MLHVIRIPLQEVREAGMAPEGIEFPQSARFELEQGCAAMSSIA